VADAVYNTRESFPGPWLMDKAMLLSLDEVFDEQWKFLQKERRRLLKNAQDAGVRQLKESWYYQQMDDEKKREAEQEARERVKGSSRFADEERVIMLTLSNGTKLPVKSFKEALECPQIRGEIVTEVAVKLVGL
jgi:hypothetical protein